MEKDQLSRKLAVILHADVVGSTTLVQKDEALAHERIQDAFNRFSETINTYGGTTRELRGDALVAEFARASDAVSAALSFQQDNKLHNEALVDAICPVLRIGISLGEVIVADGTVTGEGIVLAQRLEQLAEPDGIVVQGAVSEATPDRLGFQFDALGEVELKGFEQPVRAFVVRLAGNATVPMPEPAAKPDKPGIRTLVFSKAQIMAIALIGFISIAGALTWYSISNEFASDLPSLPPGPRIAVMPFDPGDPFSNGMTEDLIRSLSKFSNMLVFPKIATSSLQKDGADCESIREVLGANFILNGSVRRTQSKFRVNVSLVNAVDCSQLWVEKYDGELTADNLFSTTDEVVYTIASTTGSTTSGSRTIEDLIRTNNPQDLDVYDCVLLAGWYYNTWSIEDHKKARDCLEWAVTKEPNYAVAQRELADIYINEVKNGYDHKYPDSLDKAERLLNSANSITPNSDLIYYSKAIHAYMSECRGHDGFFDAAEKAISLNPNSFIITADIANFTGYSGRYDRGIALLERAKQLNPLHPDWVYFLPMLNSYRIGDYAAAVSYFQKMPRTGNHHMAKTLLAATYSRKGETSKAQELIAQLVADHPQFIENPRQPFQARRMEADLIDSIMEGLREAGHDVPPIVESNRC